jgi:archaellum component FlaG (FlaF/FlaG flagellin family)
MRRLFIAAMVIVAFSCAIVATVSADTAATPNSFQSSLDSPNAWIGKTTVDLLTNPGTPTYTVPTSSGETLAYVKHMGEGTQTSVNVEQDFDVSQGGQITAVRVSQN